MVSEVRMTKAWGLGHENGFFKKAMKKCILNINLTKTPSRHYCNRENYADSGGLDDWAISFREIKSLLLMITLSHETSLITFNGTISFPFDPKNPFTPNNILMRSGWNKRPCTIPHEGIKFDIYSFTPMRMFYCLGVTRGFKR